MNETRKTQPNPKAGLPKWVKITDQKPPQGEAVLMWFCGVKETGPWCCVDRLENRVLDLPTHWMKIIPPNAKHRDASDAFAAAPESASSNCSPFVVPPFSPPPPPAITYVWWSWHPCYPYWSESCWSAATIEEAQRYLTDPRTNLTVYHNKLIRHDGITLVEVQDVPCREMDVWHKIRRQMDEANGLHGRPGATTPKDTNAK